MRALGAVRAGSRPLGRASPLVAKDGDVSVSAPADLDFASEVARAACEAAALPAAEVAGRVPLRYARAALEAAVARTLAAPLVSVSSPEDPPSSVQRPPRNPQGQPGALAPGVRAKSGLFGSCHMRPAAGAVGGAGGSSAGGGDGDDGEFDFDAPSPEAAADARRAAATVQWGDGQATRFDSPDRAQDGPPSPRTKAASTAPAAAAAATQGHGRPELAEEAAWLDDRRRRELLARDPRLLLGAVAAAAHPPGPWEGGRQGAPDGAADAVLSPQGRGDDEGAVAELALGAFLLRCAPPPVAFATHDRVYCIPPDLMQGPLLPWAPRQFSTPPGRPPATCGSNAWPDTPPSAPASSR